ncbi:hypothetical protein Taro_007660 [Colocasia esculenta]|uniref:Uncharacterized protein n=1 Tax=Colocasia esculenta TaxID=4460 RepID=A0A843U097_COLES|nr:hypothetical protein [Colocasia esculenta]
MGLRPCGPQVVVFNWSPQLLDPFHVERQLDLSSVAARLRVTSEAHPYPLRTCCSSAGVGGQGWPLTGWRPGYRLTRGQVLKGAWRIVERVASPNCARKRRDVVQFSWELTEGSA